MTFFAKCFPSRPTNKLQCGVFRDLVSHQCMIGKEWGQGQCLKGYLNLQEDKKESYPTLLSGSDDLRNHPASNIYCPASHTSLVYKIASCGGLYQ